MYFLTHLKGEAWESVELATHRSSKAFALPVLVAVGERSVAEIDQFLYFHFPAKLILWNKQFDKEQGSSLNNVVDPPDGRGLHVEACLGGFREETKQNV